MDSVLLLHRISATLKSIIHGCGNKILGEGVREISMIVNSHKAQ